MKQSKLYICPHCDARQLGPTERCWLCNNLIAEYHQAPSAPKTPLPEPIEPERFSFSLATLFLMFTLASVCMGLLVAAPGLGVMACIVMVPVFSRTTRIVRHRESLGQEVGSGEKAALFLGSFVVSSVIAIMACVAAFCSFCGVCLAIVSFGDNHAWPFAIGVCALAIGSIVLALRLHRWNRKRFRRELGEE